MALDVAPSATPVRKMAARPMQIPYWSRTRDSRLLKGKSSTTCGAPSVCLGRQGGVRVASWLRRAFWRGIYAHGREGGPPFHTDRTTCCC